LDPETSTTPAVPPGLDTNLDEIDLGAPKIAVNLKTAEPKTTLGFGGAWGGGWSFGGIGSKSAEAEKDADKPEATSTSVWGFGSKSIGKKDDKKKSPYGFDYVEPVAETVAMPEVDDLDSGWGGWNMSAKDKKKAEKKKAQEEADKAAADAAEAVIAGLVDEAPNVEVEDDYWGGSMSKKVLYLVVNDF